MADGTLNQLSRLVRESKDVQLRRAAVLVLGEVATAQEKGTIDTLLACLDGDDDHLRLAAIDALGKLKAEGALPRLVTYVRQGGPEVEAAARAAGALGAKGTKAIQRLLDEVHPFQRRRIASALALGGTQSAALATAHALLDADPTVVDAAAKALATELPSWSASQKKALAADLVLQLKPQRKPPLAQASEAALLRVLAALHPEDAIDVFWARLESNRPKELRLIALQALGSFAPPTKESRFQVLMDVALEKDFQLAAPALLMLQKMDVNKKQLPQWRRLLEAADPATRRLAIDKLASLDDAGSAKALLAQLHHPDRQLRDAAVQALKQGPRGRKALEEGLLEAANVDDAWSLARAQLDLAREWKPAQRQQVFECACKYHEADDRRAEPLLFLLRETDHDGARDQLAAHAAELRKKKKYAEALSFYRLLTRDPACSADVRFELAATGLKVSSKDLAPEARQSEHSLGQFARLLQDTGFDLASHVDKARWLDVADLYYLGFHFVEHNHRERDFGEAVLRMLVKRNPKSAVAKDAKRKLKSEGLAT